MEKTGDTASHQSSVSVVLKQCRRKIEGVSASLVQLVKEVLKRGSVLDMLETELTPLNPARKLDGDTPRETESRGLLEKKSLLTIAHVSSDLEEYSAMLKVSGNALMKVAAHLKAMTLQGAETGMPAVPPAPVPEPLDKDGVGQLEEAAMNLSQISEIAETDKEKLEKTSEDLAKVADTARAEKEEIKSGSKDLPKESSKVEASSFVERAVGQLDEIARTVNEKTEDIDETAEDLGEVASLAEDGKTGVVASAENLRKHIESIEATEEVDRLKYQFIARVSHDLRTPLTSILGAQSLLKSGVMGKLPDGAAELLEMTERNANRLIELINDILDMERITHEKSPLCMVFETLKVVEEALEMVRSYADEQGVRVNILDEGGEIFANEIKIVQVMVNLIGNAIKFSPKGSSVDISWEETPGGTEVRVKDRGPGIKDGEREMIFEPFYQIERSDQRKVPGSGLGLAICKSIVEQHGGKIGVSARPGGGSIFWFKLPPKLRPLRVVPQSS